MRDILYRTTWKNMNFYLLNRNQFVFGVGERWLCKPQSLKKRNGFAWILIKYPVQVVPIHK